MNVAVRQSLPVLSLLVGGFILRQVGLIRLNDVQGLARLIMNSTLPAVILLSISRAQVSPARLGLLALCGMLVSLLLSFAASLVTRAWNIPRPQAGVVILGAMIINIGFFLFPIFLTVYGQEGISRLAAFDLGNSLIAHSYGFYLATQYGQHPSHRWRERLGRVLSLPVLWAVLLGLAINLAQVEIPRFVASMLDPLAAANLPLAMLTLGGFVQLRYTHWSLLILTVALRIGAGFLSGQALIRLASLESLEKVAVSMGAAMPIGMATLVYSVSEGLDAEFAAGAISLSIIVGLVTLPLLLAMNGYL